MMSLSSSGNASLSAQARYSRPVPPLAIPLTLEPLYLPKFRVASRPSMEMVYRASLPECFRAARIFSGSRPLGWITTEDDPSGWNLWTGLGAPVQKSDPGLCSARHTVQTGKACAGLGLGGRPGMDSPCIHLLNSSRVVTG